MGARYARHPAGERHAESGTGPHGSGRRRVAAQVRPKKLVLYHLRIAFSTSFMAPVYHSIPAMRGRRAQTVYDES
jgi:hypothetical protein